MIRTQSWTRRKLRTLLGLLPAAWMLSAGSMLPAQEPAEAGAEEVPSPPPAVPAAPGKASTRAGQVVVITVAGGINSGSQDYILAAIDVAEQEQAQCLVIELDTPGGGLGETQKIVKRMLNTRVPVVVFVQPRGAQAASAGTFITMAAHVAVMAPGTRIGAAHPVMMPLLPGQGQDEKEKGEKERQRDYMMEKVTNDTVAFIVGAAKQRGRNVEWAEKAVRESVSITSDEAVRLNVIDLEANNLDDLLEKIDGREVRIDEGNTAVLETAGAPVRRREMSIKQRVLNFLADPNILMILLALAALGIMMEFYHPGAIFPGVVGAICLLLALTSMQVLPVNWGGLVLVLVGIGMFIAEVYVTSYGMLGVGGAICFLVGGILLVDPSSEPHYLDPSLSVEWSVLIPLVVAMGAIVLFIGYHVVKTQRGKIETGTDGMLGLTGEARSDIDAEKGKVFVRGEHWQATSEESIPAGSKVEVIHVDGLRLQVKRKG